MKYEVKQGDFDTPVIELPDGSIVVEAEALGYFEPQPDRRTWYQKLSDSFTGNKPEIPMHEHITGWRITYLEPR